MTCVETGQRFVQPFQVHEHKTAVVPSMGKGGWSEMALSKLASASSSRLSALAPRRDWHGWRRGRALTSAPARNWRARPQPAPNRAASRRDCNVPRRCWDHAPAPGCRAFGFGQPAGLMQRDARSHRALSGRNSWPQASKAACVLKQGLKPCLFGHHSFRSAQLVVWNDLMVI